MTPKIRRFTLITLISIRLSITKVQTWKQKILQNCLTDELNKSDWNAMFRLNPKPYTSPTWFQPCHLKEVHITCLKYWRKWQQNKKNDCDTHRWWSDLPTIISTSRTTQLLIPYPSPNERINKCTVNSITQKT